VTTRSGASPVRILALGDSYTIGEGVAERERWPVRLAALLRDRGMLVGDPTIVARTGWTTDELNAGIDAAHLSGSYDLVTLLVGVNNQYRGRAATEYRTEFRALLERAAAFAGASASRVIVLSIPDWSVTPFAAGRDQDAIAREIGAYNAIAQEEAARMGAPFVDITPISIRAASDPELLASDGLHPSGAMYEQWARLVLPVASELLV
jgi:lysophospholipase L1-like esterase